MDLDHLETLARAATPGPWIQGNPWAVAGILPARFGEGQCSYCGSYELVREARLDINGKTMPAHIHRDPNPYEPDHLIVTDLDANGRHSNIAGNYDYESGGIIDPHDTAYVAAMDPTTALALITELRALQGAVPDWDARNLWEEPT